MAQYGLARLAGHGGGETVDGLAGLPVGQLPVGDAGDVGDGVTDAGADEAGGASRTTSRSMTTAIGLGTP